MTYEALGRRDDTLVVLGGSEHGLISSISRWPELADLHKDSRFQRVTTAPSKQLRRNARVD